MDLHRVATSRLEREDLGAERAGAKCRFLHDFRPGTHGNNASEPRQQQGRIRLIEETQDVEDRRLLLRRHGPRRAQAEPCSHQYPEHYHSTATPTDGRIGNVFGIDAEIRPVSLSYELKLAKK